jgi:hypothetical protein
MPRKKNTPEHIISKLRQAEIMMNQGATVVEVCRNVYSVITEHPGAVKLNG